MVSEIDISLNLPPSLHSLAGRARGRAAALNRLPAQPELLDALEKELVEHSIHATAAISGNPMRLDEVQECLAEQDPASTAPAGPTVARARREISNIGLAYAPLPKRRIETGVFGVSDGFVRKVHTVMTQGTGVPGMGTFHPQAQRPVLELVTRINAQDMSDTEQALRAGLLHYHLYRLRPFAAGNGRVARFFESSVLAVGGFRFACLMLPVFYRRRIDDYLRFFPAENTAPTGDDSPEAFLSLMLEGLHESLDELEERLAAPLRRLALTEHFRLLLERRDLNRRAHDLLVLLLDRERDAESGEPLPFLLKDLFLKTPYKLLYDKVSEHTARRDLNRLLELELLRKDGTSYFFLDRRLG